MEIPFVGELKISIIMKLISMVDFVLENAKQPYVEGTKYKDLVNYAKFLKQPLKLGMFVPCDNDGNILEQPIYTTNHSDECYCKECEEETKRCSDLQDQYQKAKEKVLFVFKPHFDISVIKHHILQDRNIEYLANFGELELTENAIKQIGL